MLEVWESLASVDAGRAAGAGIEAWLARLSAALVAASERLRRLPERTRRAVLGLSTRVATGVWAGRHLERARDGPGEEGDEGDGKSDLVTRLLLAPNQQVRAGRARTGSR